MTSDQIFILAIAALGTGLVIWIVGLGIVSQTPVSPDTTTPNTTPGACAQDVRRCPDGSFVDRVPPDCAFATCPSGTTTATTTL